MTMIAPEQLTNPLEAERLIVLPRRLDIHSLGSIRSELASVCPLRDEMLLLDGSEVEHADLAGLEFLAQLRSDLNESGIDVCIVESSLALRLVIELTAVPRLPDDREILLNGLGVAA